MDDSVFESLPGSHYERSSSRILSTQIWFLWSSCPTAETVFRPCRKVLSSLTAMGLVGQELGYARHPDASPTRSAQSIDRINPEGPGWTKRLRLGSAPPDRTLCPSRTSALEQSIRKYAEEPTKNVIRPALGLSFDLLGKAYDLYNLYTWEIGFGIRYDKSGSNAERAKCMLEIVCGCSVNSELYSNLLYFQRNAMPLHVFLHRR